MENFLRSKPSDLKITILGNMSNVLISDSGIRGCVIQLSRLNELVFSDGYVEVEARVLLPKFIQACAKQDISCCEKLFCIPGTVGGAVMMNAGIPGFELNDVLISVNTINLDGEKRNFGKEELKMSYRNGNIPKDVIVTSAKLRTSPKDKDLIFGEIKAIYEKRLKSQPIGLPTCGSTFKNPEGARAWELIKQAGCDRLSVGDAKVSEMHSNFLINSGNAKAVDFIELIDLIKAKVLEKTGYVLEEEIKRIGDGV